MWLLEKKLDWLSFRLKLEELMHTPPYTTKPYVHSAPVNTEAVASVPSRVEGLPQQTPLPPAIPGLASTRSSQKERVEFPKLVVIYNPLIGQMLVTPEVARACQNAFPSSTRIERPSESQSKW